MSRLSSNSSPAATVLAELNEFLRARLMAVRRKLLLEDSHAVNETATTIDQVFFAPNNKEIHIIRDWSWQGRAGQGRAAVASTDTHRAAVQLDKRLILGC